MDSAGDTPATLRWRFHVRYRDQDGAAAERLAAEDLDLGRAAIERGALLEALFRLGWASYVAPDAGGCRDALDRLFDAEARAGVEPPSCEPTGIFGCVHARRLWRRGALDQALDALRAASSYGGERFVAAWGLEWLEQVDDAALRSLGFERALRTLAPLVDSVSAGPGPRRAWTERVVAAARRLQAVHAHEPRAGLVLGIALSNAGEHDEAIAHAETHDAAAGTWDSAVRLGGAYRRAGRWEEALAAYRAASARDPADTEAMLDAGDVLLDLARHDEALSAYEQVLALEAEHPWAAPSALYCRHRLGDAASLEKLRAIAGAAADDVHDHDADACTCGAALGELLGELVGPDAHRARERAQELLARA